MPVIDEVIVYDAPWVKNDVVVNDSKREYAMVRKLRRQRFDAAVIFCVFSQNPLPAAFLCHLADIPLRLAYCRENPYKILTDWVPDPEPKKFIRHEVERQLDLVKTIGCTPRGRAFFAADPPAGSSKHQAAAPGPENVFPQALGRHPPGRHRLIPEISS